MVIDTSALLALLFDEPLASWVEEQVSELQTSPIMSTVNLTETLIILHDRLPGRAGTLEQELLHSAIEFIAPDLRQAALAAEARLRYPLNLGDCFAYALAKSEALVLLALDSDFRRADVDVRLPPTRS